MAVPTILSVSPAHGDVNVYKNKTLAVTFSEAPSAATVTTQTFILRNLDTDEILDVYLSVSGAVVSVRPTSILNESTSYELTIVGEDVGGGTGSLESDSTDDELVTTSRIVFTTGTDVEAPGITKTESEIEAEGDLGLPSNVQVVETPTTLEFVSTNPYNGEFGVSREFSSIQVEFTTNIDSSTVDDVSFQVFVEPYYPEDEALLAMPTDDGLCNFQFQENLDTSGVEYDYTDVEGTLSVNGAIITWVPDSARTFPANSRVRVVMASTIADEDGVTLGDNYQFTFYIQLCPNLVSIDSIRDAFYPMVLDWTDDLIGKTIYKNIVGVLPDIRWQVNHTKHLSGLRTYVLNRTVDDIYIGVRRQTDLKAGQLKRLGDLVVRYDTRIGEALSQGQSEARENWKRALEGLKARFVDVPVRFIRGYQNAEQRGYWRTRLWSSDVAHALEGSTPIGELAGNTVAHRMAKTPGWADAWS